MELVARARRNARHDERRARYLAIRIAAVLQLHGSSTHPAVRSRIGRYFAASGMVPQLDHPVWTSDPPFAIGFVREVGEHGAANRSLRHAASARIQAGSTT
jgi:hypothetical protein